MTQPHFRTKQIKYQKKMKSNKEKIEKVIWFTIKTFITILIIGIIGIFFSEYLFESVTYCNSSITYNLK